MKNIVLLSFCQNLKSILSIIIKNMMLKKKNVIIESNPNLVEKSINEIIVYLKEVKRKLYKDLINKQNNSGQIILNINISYGDLKILVS